MRASVHHIGYGQIQYEESFWTGKRELAVAGQRLTKVKRRIFTMNGENGPVECRIKGNFLTGATLCIDEDVIELSEPCKWYEIFCTVLIFAFVMVWGNIPALAAIVPMVGGAIGGAISGAAACVNLYLMRRIKNVGIKLLVWLGIFLGVLLTCFLIAQFILLLFAY